MEDIYVFAIRTVRGKNLDNRHNILSGLLTGLRIQLELALAGKTVFDGSLLLLLNKSADQSVGRAIYKTGVEWSNKLYDGLFVGWDEKKVDEKQYFVFIGKGMVFVSNLYRDLVTAGFSHPDILSKLNDVICNRMAEIKRLF